MWNCIFHYATGRLNMTEEVFAALQCMVNYARNEVRCRLVNAKAYAIRQGFSQESVDNAVKFWAKYEDSKQWNQPE
jgi:hypothetical protein